MTTAPAERQYARRELVEVGANVRDACPAHVDAPAGSIELGGLIVRMRHTAECALFP